MVDFRHEFDGNVVEVIKTEKGFEVRVTGAKNVDVLVNGDCVYAEYVDVAYKHVPLNMRDFVKEHVYDIGTNDSGDIKGAYADVSVSGRDLTIYFPMNQSEAIHARFTLTDPLDDVLCMLDEYAYESEAEKDEIKSEVTSIYAVMTDGLKELGFELKYSHSMNERFWGWHDLVFKANEFDKKRFVAASAVIGQYDKDFDALITKYKLFR